MAFRAPVDLAAVNAHAADTLVSHLGIVITEAGDDWLRGTMPVDARTKQPFGLLHGGSSVALAETLASFAGYLCLDPDANQQAAVESLINDRLKLIEVNFPVFGDGRGYSAARILREAGYSNLVHLLGD